MAPVAFILGGICGTVSAMLSWLLLGLGFWSALQVYFIVGLVVAALVIAAALMGPRDARKSEKVRRTPVLPHA